MVATSKKKESAFPVGSPTPTVAKSDMKQTSAAAKEEALQKKLVLQKLKKRKADMQAKIDQAEKAKQAKASEEAQVEPKEPSEGTGDAEPKTIQMKSSAPNTTSPMAELAEAASRKAPLPTVDEKPSTEAAPSSDDTGVGEKKGAVENVSQPMVFGASSTLTAPPTSFGMPPNSGVSKPFGLPKEPSVPKPTFGFGSGTASNAPSFGSMAAKATGSDASQSDKPAVAFGQVASKVAFGSGDGFGSVSGFGKGGFGSSAAPASTPADNEAKGGSSAFLNLTPPTAGGGTVPKFSFGKSNITLTAPAAANPFEALKKQSSFGSNSFAGGGATFGTAATGFESSTTGFGSSAGGQPKKDGEDKADDPESKKESEDKETDGAAKEA